MRKKLKKKRFKQVFLLICFEVAFCLLFSAMGILFLRSGSFRKEATKKEAAENDVMKDIQDGEEEVLSGCSGTIETILDNGALVTSITPSVLRLYGMDQNDLIYVSVGGKDYILPVEIDEELFSIWGRTKFALDKTRNEMVIERDNQDFAIMEEFTDKIIGEEVSVKLLQTDAYDMEYCNTEGLSIEETANFRCVQTGDLGEGILYRGHSPIDPEYEDIRCRYSDDLAWEKEIMSMINLNQNMDKIEYVVHEQCPKSYYRFLYDQGDVSGIKLDGKEALKKEFGLSIASQLRFMLKHPGPYMVHCRNGKDRAGFMIALLEALEGTTYKEIGEEYAKTFRNYYGVKEGSWMDEYNQTDGANTFLKMMKRGDTRQYLNDDGTLVREAARSYMLDIGLSVAEIDSLQELLATDIDQMNNKPKGQVTGKTNLKSLQNPLLGAYKAGK